MRAKIDLMETVRFDADKGGDLRWRKREVGIYLACELELGSSFRKIAVDANEGFFETLYEQHEGVFGPTRLNVCLPIVAPRIDFAENAFCAVGEVIVVELQPAHEHAAVT
jgi:hypothetical protein